MRAINNQFKNVNMKYIFFNLLTICLFLIPISTQAQLELLEVNGVAKIGIDIGTPPSWTPTLAIFGDNIPGNFVQFIKQGGDGADKGIIIQSPNSSASGRIFMEDNKFIIGRGNAGNNKVLIFDVIGNIGIGQETPLSKLHVTDGDIYIDNISNGVIMKSPDTQCWRYTPDNTGQLIPSAITCPN